MEGLKSFTSPKGRNILSREDQTGGEPGAPLQVEVAVSGVVRKG